MLQRGYPVKLLLYLAIKRDRFLEKILPVLFSDKRIGFLN
jgi:hypothetical protein